MSFKSAAYQFFDVFKESIEYPYDELSDRNIGHEDLLEKYQKKTLTYKTPSKKRKLDFEDSKSPQTPSSSLLSNTARSIKYGAFSKIQKERFDKLMAMIVKCMLPISIIENPAFREYIQYLDPSFNIPCV